MLDQTLFARLATPMLCATNTMLDENVSSFSQSFSNNEFIFHFVKLSHEIHVNGLHENPGVQVVFEMFWELSI